MLCTLETCSHSSMLRHTTDLPKTCWTAGLTQSAHETTSTSGFTPSISGKSNSLRRSWLRGDTTMVPRRFVRTNLTAWAAASSSVASTLNKPMPAKLSTAPRNAGETSMCEMSGPFIRSWRPCSLAQAITAVSACRYERGRVPSSRCWLASASCLSSSTCRAALPRSWCRSRTCSAPLSSCSPRYRIFFPESLSLPSIDARSWRRAFASSVAWAPLSSAFWSLWLHSSSLRRPSFSWAVRRRISSSRALFRASTLLNCCLRPCFPRSSSRWALATWTRCSSSRRRASAVSCCGCAALISSRTAAISARARPSSARREACTSSSVRRRRASSSTSSCALVSSS
mmetsp:Transcript_13375/g.38003  ORF Transcript_13375/g.38003 Transcript_13375/m.38003 type:complete len:342 (+) Transcript_13375:1771-2796(+)